MGIYWGKASNSTKYWSSRHLNLSFHEASPRIAAPKPHRTSKPQSPVKACSPSKNAILRNGNSVPSHDLVIMTWHAPTLVVIWHVGTRLKRSQIKRLTPWCAALQRCRSYLDLAHHLFIKSVGEYEMLARVKYSYAPQDMYPDHRHHFSNMEG